MSRRRGFRVVQGAMGALDHMTRSDSHVLRSLSHGYRSDEQPWIDRMAQRNIGYPKSSRFNSCTCFFCLFLFIVVICISAFICADLFLWVAMPKLTLADVKVTALSSNVTSSYNQASLRLNAAAVLSLHNSDLGKFRYRAGTINVLYGNSTTSLGKLGIKSGLVLGKSTSRINAALEIKAGDNLQKNYSFISDVANEKLVKMRWLAELRGHVRVVKIITMPRSSFMNCSLTLNLTAKAVQDLRC